MKTYMDFQSNHTSSSSSLSSLEIMIPKIKNPIIIPQKPMKKSGGRKIFKETRHPIYRGVRRKNGCKWVCELRESNKKSRIWLGTFPDPETAAVAHDVAALALRGDHTPLNFQDSARWVPHPESLSHRDIQRAVLEATRDFKPSSSLFIDLGENEGSACGGDRVLGCEKSSFLGFMDIKKSGFLGFRVQHPESSSHRDIQSAAIEGTRDFKPSTTYSSLFMNMGENEGFACGGDRVLDIEKSGFLGFMDEEEMFNMPDLLDGMAEGMLLTPLALKKGFNWSAEVDDEFDFDLWATN